MRRRAVDYVLIYIKGLAMGAADIVPGVSGGTIAFISGIYDELLDSLRRLSPTVLIRLYRDGFAATWKYINGTFLASLLAGILTSIFTLAGLLTWLLQDKPELLWSFFFGLIAVSSWLMLKQLELRRLTTWGAVLLGVAFAWWITVANPITLTPSYPVFFAGGMLAICAMILPGISGSFILLLLGLYGAVIGAVNNFDWMILVVVATGCICGLLAFSHLLHWLLSNVRNLTLSLLTGLILGSLNKVWPWKETLQYRLDHTDQWVPFIQANISPLRYASVTGQDANLVIAVLLMGAGFLLVLGLDYWGRRISVAKP